MKCKHDNWNTTEFSNYRKSGNFHCKNIFVVDGGYEN